MAHKKCESKIKFCPKCSLSKQITDFGRDASRPDGRYAYCKACKKRLDGPLVELNRLAKLGQRKCSICLVVKPFSAFHSDPQKTMGVTSKCRKCTSRLRREKSIDWYEALKEQKRLLSQGLKRCLACDEVKKTSEFGRANHSGLKPRCLLCMRIYFESKKSSKRDYLKAEVFERDDYLCYLCEEPIDMTLAFPHVSSPSVDHVVPLSKGGTDDFLNVKATHLKCNLDKKDYLLEEYLAKINIL